MGKEALNGAEPSNPEKDQDIENTFKIPEISLGSVGVSREEVSDREKYGIDYETGEQLL